MSIFDELRTLAGVTEKYQTGSSGQAKGKDPMPKTSKPSANGEQPHPLKGKLVGKFFFLISVLSIPNSIAAFSTSLSIV